MTAFEDSYIHTYIHTYILYIHIYTYMHAYILLRVGQGSAVNEFKYEYVAHTYIHT